MECKIGVPMKRGKLKPLLLQSSPYLLKKYKADIAQDFDIAIRYI
jgi:hypothetical protein